MPHSSAAMNVRIFPFLYLCELFSSVELPHEVHVNCEGGHKYAMELLDGKAARTPVKMQYHN